MEPVPASPSDRPAPSPAFLLVLLCGATGVALGGGALLALGAPRHYLAVNGGALLVGMALACAMRAVRRMAGVPSGTGAVVTGCTLLATALAGVTIDGATRWIAFAGVTLQPSLVLLPAAIVAFTSDRDSWSAAGLALAAVALGLQPDRAMAAALVAGLSAVALLRPASAPAWALAAAVAGLAAAGLRADRVPPVPFVEGVVPAAIAFHPLVGLAVVAGLAAMLAPVVAAARRPRARATLLVFGAVWLAVVVASLIGPYPTPLVGYGSSAILGYCLSAAAIE